MPTKPFTKEQELDLIADRDNKKSLDKLVVANLGLVHSIVHKFPIKNASCTYDDLFQEGVAGLIHAIHKFEPERGYRLTTYSYRWIQAYVSRYYQNHGRTIRVPVHMATKQMKMNKQVEMLTRELGRTPSQEEINDLCEHAEEVRSSMAYVSSLNQLIGESEELECLQGEDRTDEFDSQVDCEMLLDKVQKTVSDRDFDVLLRRFGLRGRPEHTLSEISEIHGITRARIHQIQRQMLTAMREMV